MNKLHLGLLIIVFIVFGFLRLYNLGISEYIPDETTVMTPVKQGRVFNLAFLNSQRKGPVQFVVASLVSLAGISTNNELFYRLPYALASLLGLLFAYLALTELTGNKSIALISTTFIGVNGFLVAFGRIVQYQSFNILFSFAGLYFYAKALRENISDRSKMLFSLSGLLYLFLSLASHWDVIFFLPLYVIVFFQFLKNNPGKLSKWFLALHVFVLVTLYIPFLAIYLNTFFKTADHQVYFNGRLGYVSLNYQVLMSKLSEFLFRNQLYHPSYYLEVLLSMTCLGILAIKKSWRYLLWLFYCVLLFVLFVKKPGTHIYNLYLPLSVLSGYGFWVLAKVFKKYLIIIPSLTIAFIFGFFVYQNYLLFLDSSVEYPWEQETVYKTKTRKYDQITLSNNIIGFPLNRHWEEINQIIQEDIRNAGANIDDYTYITNEVKSVSAFYMDIPYGSSSRMYAIGIKNPTRSSKTIPFRSFTTDVQLQKSKITVLC